MACSLSSLANNLAERLRKGKCENCEFGLEYAVVKDNILTFKCLNCNNNFEKEFGEGLTKRFQKAYRFCDADINTFYLMLQKGVYLHEYMDSWERFN